MSMDVDFFLDGETLHNVCSSSLYPSFSSNCVITPIHVVSSSVGYFVIAWCTVK